MSEEASRSRIRNIVGGSAGNLVEWYDWYVYAAFTLYFAPVFFPEGDRTAQLLSAAAIFAVRSVLFLAGVLLAVQVDPVSQCSFVDAQLSCDLSDGTRRVDDELHRLVLEVRAVLAVLPRHSLPHFSDTRLSGPWSENNGAPHRAATSSLMLHPPEQLRVAELRVLQPWVADRLRRCR